MNNFEIKLFSLNTTSVLVFESSEDISPLVLELVSLFAKEIDTENLQMKIEQLQNNTDELKKRVFFFVDKYKDKSQGLNRFRKFFDKLGEGEYFLILPNNEFTSEQIAFFSNYLISLNEGKDFDSLNRENKKIFGSVLENYNIIAYDTARKVKIGEGLKENRVCRFCKKKQPDVTFSNEAHAISEALGNKTLFINEECNTCNEIFDKKIERDIISYLGYPQNIFWNQGQKKENSQTNGRKFHI